MNNQKEQKIRERQLLNHLMASFSDFPKGKVEQCESPDFAVRESIKSTTGVELTALHLSDYNASDRTILDATKQNIIKKAKAQLQSLTTAPSFAHFIFSKNINLKELKETNTLGLSQAIHKQIGHLNSNRYFQQKISGEKLPSVIDSLFLAHHPEDKVSYWGHGRHCLNQESFLNRLQAVIYRKEEKLRLYRHKSFNSYWLVITINCLQGSFSFNLNNLFQRWNFSSSFDKLLLFEQGTGKCYHLNN